MAWIDGVDHTRAPDAWRIVYIVVFGVVVFGMEVRGHQVIGLVAFMASRVVLDLPVGNWCSRIRSQVHSSYGGASSKTPLGLAYVVDLP